MRKRPGRLWLFFWGRRRRGFPWLLLAVIAIPLVLAIAYALPGGADLSRWFWFISFTAISAITLAAIAMAVLGIVRPPRKR